MELKLGEYYRDTKSGFVGVLAKAGILNSGDSNPRAILERPDGETWEGPESRIEPPAAVASTSDEESSVPVEREEY